jgi:hypothetical protein
MRRRRQLACILPSLACSLSPCFALTLPLTLTLKTRAHTAAPGCNIIHTAKRTTPPGTPPPPPAHALSPIPPGHTPTEFCQQGDLFHMRGQVSELEVKHIMWQLLWAVKVRARLGQRGQRD